jgi:hypothetical protein
MRRCFGGILLAGLMLAGSPAFASVQVSVDIGSQRMKVFVDGTLRHVWRVSTGRGKYRTPTGSYRPKRLERSWFSTKYAG